MRELDRLRVEIGNWRGLAKSIEDQIELLDLAEVEEDADVIAGVAIETSIWRVGRASRSSSSCCSAARTTVGRRSWPFMLEPAAPVAGLGGDADAHVSPLGERNRYAAKILSTSPGEEAGIKSATLEITGRLAYGYLNAERGVHRLVRPSPYDRPTPDTPRSRSPR